MMRYWLGVFVLVFATGPVAFGQEKNAAHYNNEGVAKANRGDYAGAVEDYTKAIALDPKFATAYYNRGHARVEQGDFTGGIADYTRAIELDPKNDKPYINRGYAYVKLGQLPAAINDFTRAIELNSQEALPYLHRGNAYREAGRPKQAIEDYDRLIRMNPKNAAAFALRGTAHMDLREYEKAIEDWEKAIEADPARKSALQPRIDEARERIKSDPNRVKKYQEAVPPPKKVERIPTSFHIATGVWASDWNFRALTVTRQEKNTTEAMFSLSMALETGLTKFISIGAAYEHCMSSEIDADLVSLYGKYLIPTSQPEWWGFPEHLDLKLGLIVGTVDVDNSPGNFDTAVGLTAGVDYRRYFTPKLSLDLAADFRWIEFDFNPNDSVVSSDSSIGGAGLSATVGLGVVF